MDHSRMLGEEKISKLLMRFSVPCVMGLLISAFYNIVDQIFIGNSSLGYLGNAATGISFPIICICNAFAWCVGDGAAAFLSICAGRNDSENAHKCVGTGLSATALISVILMVVCLLFREPLMVLFGASDQTLSLAVDYFEILAVFFPVYLMINVMNSMIRADGSPAYAMMATGIGAILNIILDPIFIFVFDWGIVGAAAATVIGQSVSFVVSILYFRKPKTFHLTKESFHIDGKMLRNLVVMGGSTFIIQISIVVMNVLSNVSLFHYGNLSQYGSDIPISVFSIQTKVYTIVCNIAVGITLGGQPVFGYNYGAGKMDRVRKAYQMVLISVLTLGVAATAVFEFCPHLIIRLFGGGNALYEEFAVKMFRIYLSFCILTLLIKLSSIFFQSIGKAAYAMVASVLRDLCCLVVFTLVLCRYFEGQAPGMGIYGVMLAAPLSDLVAGSVVIFLTVKFFRGLKKEESREENAADIRETRPGFIITIAREHGSMGKQIGKLVAEELGIPFYYKEMMALAAKESGLAQEFIEEMNVNSPTRFRQLYLSTSVVSQAVIAQEKIIRRIAGEGACVITGRAADYVLRDRDDVIRIFIHAPEESRIRNIMEMYGDDREAAKANMERADKARESYYRNISGSDWKDADHYDLCLSSSLGKEKTAAMIVNYINFRKSIS